MVSLVEKMLSLHKQLPETDTPHEKTALQAARSRPWTGRSTRGPALWADGGGDRDWGGGEQVDSLNLADYLADEIYLFHADEENLDDH
jgi:hypothetical protein